MGGPPSAKTDLGWKAQRDLQDIDADKASRQPPRIEVEDDDSDNRHRPQAVDVGAVPFLANGRRWQSAGSLVQSAGVLLHRLDVVELRLLDVVELRLVLALRLAPILVRLQVCVLALSLRPSTALLFRVTLAGAVHRMCTHHLARD